MFELANVKSNPSYESVLEGSKIARENSVDLILAVGGGSVIDCAKAISVSAYCEGDPWEKYWTNFEDVTCKTIPVGAVLTMAGTGSESNGGSVITNEEKMIKNGKVFDPSVYPKFSVLNPEYTFTVPVYQMASGIFDTFSHLCEQYFSGDDDNTTDYITEGVMRSLINSAKAAIKNPKDYEARSNIMWCATIGLNTITGLSKQQDWEVHMIEHQLGAYTDCAHGAGLAAISPAYYRYIYPFGIDKFVRFAKNVWDIDVGALSKEDAANAGIKKIEEFIALIGLPSSLKQLGATEDMLQKIADSTIPGGGYKKMTSKDILSVLKNCF